MADVFATLLKKAAQQGIVPAETQKARNWFRKEAASVSRVAPNTLIKTSTSTQSTSAIGKMFLFGYSPKHSDTLPYYDRFPLIFPFKQISGGFYGINMHYLPLPMRAALMDSLYQYVNRDQYDEKTSLSLSYKTLTSAATLKYYKPCVKHYLNSQIQTELALVPANLWDIALFLPLERFAKASSAQVYRESRKIIGKA